MIHVQRYHGARADLLPLFRMADESESEILSYYQRGDAIVALDDEKFVGMAHVENDGKAVQIISLAVMPCRRREGIGCRLIEEAVSYCRANGVCRLTVCTAAWETENTVFYIKRGFCPYHVERGYFTLEKGYAEVGDQVRFQMKV